jgi:hypothetical protein
MPSDGDAHWAEVIEAIRRAARLERSRTVRRLLRELLRGRGREAPWLPRSRVLGDCR